MGEIGRLFKLNGGFATGALVLALLIAGAGVADAQTTVLTMERSVPQGYYVPDETLDIAVTFSVDGSGVISTLGLQEEVPAGWTFNSYVSGPYPILMPGAGATGTLEFAWLSPVLPATFVYRVNVPAGVSGPQTLVGRALYRVGNGPEEVTPDVETVINPEENHPPVLDPIGNQTMVEDDVLVVPISATDPDGDALAFTGTGLPAFASLVDNGDGTATLTLSPGFDDAGTYPGVEITVTDAGTPALSDSEVIEITVMEGGSKRWRKTTCSWCRSAPRTRTGTRWPSRPWVSRPLRAL